MTFSGWFTDIFGIELNLEEFLSRQLSVAEEFGSLDEDLRTDCETYSQILLIHFK